MDRLPPEITQRIANLVLEGPQDPPDCWEHEKLIASYAAISREWQALVEPHTFEILFLSPDRLEKALEEGILTPVRQSYIRIVYFHVKLPPTRISLWGFVTGIQHRSEILFSAVADLLEHMSTWPTLPRGVQLTLYLSGGGRYSQPAGAALGFRREGTHHRQLPEVAAITSFSSCCLRREMMCLDPSTACEIASRFPNLQTISLDLIDRANGCRSDSVDYVRRVQQRKDLADGLSILPGSVRDFCVREVGSGPELVEDYTDHEDEEDDEEDDDEEEEEGDFEPPIPTDGLDPFCVSLREFSKQLDVLEISGRMIIGREFFDHPDLDKDGKEALWPRLQHILLPVHVGSPQGHLIFNKNWSIWDSNVQPHDELPNTSEQMNMYNLTVARAATQMPMLERMKLTCRDQPRPTLHYNVSADPSGARFECSSSPPLKLSGEVEDEWWKTAQTHIRDGAEFHFSVGNAERPQPHRLVEWTRSKV